MTHTFLHRQVKEYKAPLPRGRYTAQLDFYEVERGPRIGELCVEYIAHVLQSGNLVRTIYEKFEVA